MIKLSSEMEKPISSDLHSHEKIKAIPRKTLPLTIYRQSTFKSLLKKGIKLKSLIFDIPQDTSLIKRYTRYCKSSVQLQASFKRQKDDKTLRKIHHKLQYLKSLQIDGIVENEKPQKSLERFIRQSKHLQAYKSLPNPVFVVRNHLSTEKRIKFVFHLKKSASKLDSKRPQGVITALSASLRCLVSISGNQEAIAFEMNISTDPQSESFSDDIQQLNRGLKRVSFLDSITVPLNLRDEAHHFLPLFKVKDLKVRTHSDLAFLTRINCRKIIEDFLSRKSAKLLVWPSSYSWSNLMEMLNLSQQMREKNGSCLSFVDFLFDFHSPVEIREALISHLSKTNTKWERFVFKFKTNSLDWFNEEKRGSLQEIMETLLKEENLAKCEGITFSLVYISEFSNELLLKILKEISSVILYVVQSAKKSQKEMQFTLNTDAQGIWSQDILWFLAQFQEAKYSINLFQLKGISKKVNNVARNLVSLQREFPICDKEKIQKLVNDVREQLKLAEELKNENEKIRDHLFQSQQAGCFEIMNLEQLDKIQDLMSELVKVEAKIKDQRKKWSPNFSDTISKPRNLHF